MTDDLPARLKERDALEAELAAPQPQTGAWLTEDKTLLLRRYGDTFTVCQRDGDRWGPEFALSPEAWDFGASA